MHRTQLAEQKRKCSGNFATPSPPAKKKKTTARQDQAEQPATVPSGIGKVEN
jgi:hypothetical protein